MGTEHLIFRHLEEGLLVTAISGFWSAIGTATTVVATVELNCIPIP